MTKVYKSVVPISKIKGSLRRLHLHCTYKNKAKQRCKRDIATYECENCSKLLYEGKSDKRYEELKESWKSIGRNLERGKLEMDHLRPVVEPKKGFGSWDDYIHGLWVDDKGYAGICRDCHAKKSAKEAAERAEYGTLKRKK